MPLDRTKLKSQMGRCIANSGIPLTWGAVSFSGIISTHTELPDQPWQALAENGETVRILASRSSFTGALPAQGAVFLNATDGLSYRVLTTPESLASTGNVAFLCQPFKTPI